MPPTDAELVELEARRQELREQYLRSAADRPASPGRGIHHAALICSDVEQTIQFYQGLLGFPLVELVENRDYKGSSHLFFDVGNKTLLGFFDFPKLGLEPGKVNVLVALGQGPEVDAAVRRCLARLAFEPGVQVAALESSISSRLEVPEGVVLLRDTYPVSRYYRAFDFAVSAAGYNAYHELIAFAVPSVFVPMPRELDDQAARAHYAETAGVALACERGRFWSSNLLQRSPSSRANGRRAHACS